MKPADDYRAARRNTGRGARANDRWFTMRVNSEDVLRARGHNGAGLLPLIEPCQRTVRKTS